MSYTWQNGEVITAEKLNQTSGSGTRVVTLSELGQTVNESLVQELFDSLSNVQVEIAEGQMMYGVLVCNDTSEKVVMWSYFDNKTGVFNPLMGAWLEHQFFVLDPEAANEYRNYNYDGTNYVHQPEPPQ